MEKYGIYVDPFSEVRQLSNGTIIVAYNNNTFDVYGPEQLHPLFRDTYRPNWRFKRTPSGVVKTQELYERGDEPLILRMYNGKKIHNGFGLTDAGIFSFLTEEIVTNLPDGATEYEVDSEGDKVFFVVKGKRYSFNGIAFTEF